MGPRGLTAEWIVKQAPLSMRSQVRRRLALAQFEAMALKLFVFSVGVGFFGLLVFGGFWLAGAGLLRGENAPALLPEVRQIGLYVLAPFGGLVSGITAVWASDISVSEEYQRRLGDVMDAVYERKRELQLPVPDNPPR